MGEGYKNISLYYRDYHDTKTVTLVLDSGCPNGYYYYMNNSGNFLLKHVLIKKDV